MNKPTDRRDGLDELELPPLTTAQLRQGRIHTIAQLCTYTEEGLLRLDGIGYVRLYQVKRALTKRSRYLKNTPHVDWESLVESLVEPEVGRPSHELYACCKDAGYHLITDVTRRDGLELRRAFRDSFPVLLESLAARKLKIAPPYRGRSLLAVVDNVAMVRALGRARIQTPHMLLSHTEAALIEKLRGSTRDSPAFVVDKIKRRLQYLGYSLPTER